MTREEAIEVIEQDIPCEHDIDLIEALDMAIKALSQEPKYRMAYDYADGKMKKYVWDNGWTEIEQEPICDRDCEHCTWTECPIEPCDDAISRDMALEKMADYVASGYADSVKDFEEYSRIICQLPSVSTTKNIVNHGTMNITL